MMPKPAKLILLDVNSFIYRAFYTLPKVRNSFGYFTHAIDSFLEVLSYLMEKENPTYLLAVFDSPAPTLRNMIYSDYKSHRQKTPYGLEEQILPIKEILAARKIKVVSASKGFEADDIIGAYCHQTTAEGIESLIVTGDTDVLQLVSDKLKVALIRKGVTTVDIFDTEKVKEEYGLLPEQIVDFKALKGNSSDNIPGVPGIGEKKATKLLQKFGTLDEVLENTTLKNLKLYREQALLSRELVAIYSQVPLDVHLPDCERKPYDMPRLRGEKKQFQNPGIN
ncbi:MAG: 5'-3' exonuclease [Alkaliphilus sp.]